MKRHQLEQDIHHFTSGGLGMLLMFEPLSQLQLGLCRVLGGQRVLCQLQPGEGVMYMGLNTSDSQGHPYCSAFELLLKICLTGTWVCINPDCEVVLSLSLE